MNDLCHQEDFAVKRDMELIRKILLKIEAKENLAYETIEIDGVPPAIMGRHMEMLLENGLIEGAACDALGHDYSLVQVRDLSWAGHEFLSNISKDEVWNKLKEDLGANGLSSLSLDVLKDLAKAAASEWAKKKLGLA